MMSEVVMLYNATHRKWVSGVRIFVGCTKYTYIARQMYIQKWPIWQDCFYFFFVYGFHVKNGRGKINLYERSV